jgi:hypothetical protein
MSKGRPRENGATAAVNPNPADPRQMAPNVMGLVPTAVTTSSAVLRSRDPVTQLWDLTDDTGPPPLIPHRVEGGAANVHVGNSFSSVWSAPSFDDTRMRRRSTNPFVSEADVHRVWEQADGMLRTSRHQASQDVGRRPRASFDVSNDDFLVTSVWEPGGTMSTPACPVYCSVADASRDTRGSRMFQRTANVQSGNGIYRGPWPTVEFGMRRPSSDFAVAFATANVTGT